MPLKFWLGGANSDKSSRLIKYILDEADKNPATQYLYVVPEQFGLSTQQALVNSSKNRGILNIDVLSFTRLAHRIGDEVGTPMSDAVTLDDMGKSLLIGMLAAKHRKDLSVFGDDLEKPGYTDKIKSVISEFMQYGISAEKAAGLSKTAKKSGRNLLAAKLSDIALIYGKFKEYTKDRYTTVEETLDAVSELVPHSDTIKNSVVIFDGFTGFTPVQNKLIGVLMEYAKDMHVALLLDDCIQGNDANGSIQEHELFYLSKNTMNQLGRMADERHIVIADPYKADEYALSNTCNSIGRIVYTNDPQITELNNTTVNIFSAADPDEEVRMVISRIKELVRSGYRYRDIAILAGDIESLRHPIERRFPKHDIPYFIDRTEPVLLNPFIEYIRAFIAVIRDNFSHDSVFHFLKTNLAGFSDDEICALENYCIAKGIKGRKKWHEAFVFHTSAAGDDELYEINKTREKLINRCDSFARELSGDGNISASSKFTVRQLCTALYTMIESDGIEDRLKEKAAEFEKSSEPKLADEYGSIYVKIMNILDELCLLIPDEKTDIRGFSNLLDSGFENIRIGTIPKGMDYVQVGDLQRSRFDRIKALFIMGANDGSIPNPAKPAGLINENEREFMLRADSSLVLAPTARQEIYTQQLYIYMALMKPEEHLYVSFSRTGADGSSLLPSFIVGKLMSSVPGVLIEGKPDICEYYSDEEEAFTDLCDTIVPCLTGKSSAEAFGRAKELLKYFADRPDYKDRLSKAVSALILPDEDEESDTIGAALAHAIYGKRIISSITRLESYANCAYRYFLEYGLTLHDREVFSFEARDIGTIFHDSLRVYSTMLRDRGEDWSSIPDDDSDEIMDEAVSKVIESYRIEKLSSSARYAYMEQRIRRIMKKSARVLSEQLKKGEFVPKYFEVDFEELEEGRSVSMRLSDDEILRLRGRIDRIDTCETDEGIYVKVIDYKSSKHEMDLAAVYEGRQLQLLVYLNAAMDSEKLALKDAGKDTEVIPAGVLYYKIDDPMISADKPLSYEDIRKTFMNNMRLNGLVNSDETVLRLFDRDISSTSSVLRVGLLKDGGVKSSKQAVSGDDFNVLSGYVTKKISDMGCDILSGNIAIPLPDGKTRFTEPECRYCPYGAVCSNTRKSYDAPSDEDEEYDDDEDTPKIKKSDLSNSDWIELMKKEL